MWAVAAMPSVTSPARLGCSQALPSSQRCSHAGTPLTVTRRYSNVSHSSSHVSAAMGIGFDLPASTPKRSNRVCLPEYGLTVNQMAALGLSNQDSGLFKEDIAPELLRASAYYSQDKVSEHTRMATRMSAGTGAAPGQAPPDLPSLLLDGRICYIGMPLVPAVTELVISELLWLNYANPEKPVYVYLNSIGSQQADGQAVGFDTEAYAILDTLNYIRPEIHTLVVGQAYGNAAMILASGKKGCRFALPNARIMTAPPRMNRSFGSTSNMMIKANELEYNTQTYVDFLAKFTGRDKESVRKDVGRNRYFTPQQAVEYGLVDRIVRPEDDVRMEKRDYERMLQQSQAGQRSQRAPANAEAGQ